jgi:hypothetical protein
MKKIVLCLLAALPFACFAGDYESSLLVQTGQLRESDLIVRTLTDLESNKECLAFYVRTTGTSPAMHCYDVKEFRSKVRQVSHFKDGKLVIRKLSDTLNNMACLVAYVSTKGTAPVIDCYEGKKSFKDSIVRKGHLQEGDLHVHRIVDTDSAKTCLVAHVSTGGTSASLACYEGTDKGPGGLEQIASLREGDLVVRKIADRANARECLITYVSTEGTSPYIHCMPGQAAPAVVTEQNAQFRPTETQ